MATISFTVSNGTLTELIDTFGVNYQETIDGEPNPQTKQQFARAQIIAMFKQAVHLHRKRAAASAASQADPDIT